MSQIGLLFYLGMGGSILVSQGIIPLRPSHARPAGAVRHAVLMIASCALATPVYSFVYQRILSTLKLESLAPFLVALAYFSVVFLMKSATSLLKGAKKNGKDSASAGSSIYPSPPLVAYGCILAASAYGGSGWNLFAAGASAALGFLVASTVLEDIMDRLELEAVPAPFHGLPARFLSAGLMALAFSGLDMSLYARIG